MDSNPTIPKLRKGVQALGLQVRAITKKNLKGTSRALASIMLDWPLMVGEEISKLCEPSAIRRQRDGGIFLELAASSAASAMLIYTAPQIVERINTYLGYKAINDIKFSHKTLKPHSKGKPAPKQKTPKEVDFPALHNFENEALKLALEKLGSSIEND